MVASVSGIGVLVAVVVDDDTVVVVIVVLVVVTVAVPELTGAGGFCGSPGGGTSIGQFAGRQSFERRVPVRAPQSENWNGLSLKVLSPT